MRQESPEEVIRQRLSAVQRRIAAAAERAGRDPSDIRLIVITKGQPVPRLRVLAESGQTLLGENRVEEALPKIDALGDLPGLSWHLVGALQSRKVPLVGDRFDLIHSVDRVKVARRLDRVAADLGRPQRILLEWNVSGEPSKAGWRLEQGPAWEAAVAEVGQVLSLPNLVVEGLMTVGPLTDDVETQRAAFRRVAELRRRLGDRLGCDLPELSMGMSDDFEAAILEGATIVRIGRAVLGERM
jgi:pyridoxal phosphate enzyme (YggS family)